MVDFEELVEGLLLELGDPAEGASGEATTEDPSDPGLSKVRATNLQKYLSDSKVYAAIKSAYEDKGEYNKATFPMISPEELKQLGAIVADKSLRSTKGSQFFPKLEITYPLLDILAELAKVFKRGGESDDKNADAEMALKAFAANLEKNASSIPLDYQPINPWAQTVKQDYYSKQRGSLGQIRLEELSKDLSIYGAIKHLLKLRQEATAFKYPKEKIPDPKQYIADIFLKPNFYIRGEKAVPSDETMRELYDETTSDLLVGVSTAAYELFKQQALSIVGVDDTTKKPKLTNEEQAYAAYIGATSDKAIPFRWDTFAVKTESFKMNFNSFVCNWMQFLSEKISTVKLLDGKPAKVDSEKQGVIKFTILDKVSYSKGDMNKPDPNFDPIYLTIKDLDNIYNTNKQVQKEISEYRKKYNWSVGNQPNLMIKSDQDALFNYFSNATGPNSTEENALFKAVQAILSQRAKDNLAQKRKNKSTTPLKGEPAPGEARFFETALNSGEFLYSLGNVEKFQQEVPPAGVLYQKLQGLADFIKKEVNRDYLGAMNKITAGLAGLAGASPNAGGG